jgi:hypothetical protein
VRADNARVGRTRPHAEKALQTGCIVVSDSALLVTLRRRIYDD